MLLHSTRHEIVIRPKVLRRLAELRADGVIVALTPEDGTDAGSGPDPGGLRTALDTHTPPVLGRSAWTAKPT